MLCRVVLAPINLTRLYTQRNLIVSYTNKDFNPSGSKSVDDIKEAAESLAKIIEEACPSGPLKDKAILDVQSASMFAVKSLF